jgi:uncharacterized protein (TIGR02145 family)
MNMSKNKFFLAAASLLLAMAFTISCSSGNDDDEDNPVIGGGKGNDIESYRTKKIGTQTWMAENLDYAVEGSKCYNNDSLNCVKYGRLYNWATAMTVCPSGWHLPSTEDWETLLEYVQTDNGNAFTSGENASIAGKYLKAKSGWNEGGNGEDKYSFAALPGGYILAGGSLNGGYYGIWWSSSEKDDKNAYYTGMGYNHDGSGAWDHYGKSSFSLSVRCVKD